MLHGQMADPEKLSALKQSLLQRTDLAAALHNLNTLLEASSSARIQEIASFLSLQLLFECLGFVSSDEELVKITCAVLWKIFSVLSPREVCQQRLYLELGLQHDSEHVRKVCLSSLQQHMREDEIHQMITASTMFHLVTQTLGDDSLECARLASDLLLSILEDPASLDDQLKTGLLLDWEAVIEKSETVRFRVYELAVQLSQRGKEAFKFVLSSGLLQRLLTELSSGDLLVQMNCVEMLLPLMEDREGMQFLESKQVVATMHGLLLSARQDPLGAVIIPSIFKFFGHISRSTNTNFTELSQHYPEFLQTVLSACLSPEDVTQWGVAVDTLGMLGSTPGGRAVLEGCGSTGKEAMRTLGKIMAEGSSDLRVRVLHSLTLFFSLTESSEEGLGWKSVDWFHQLHSKPLSVLMTTAKQPFADLRTSSLKFLLAIAPHEWGQRELNSFPGFLEYLLDRRTETDKIGKELKYDIVHCLVASGTAEAVFESVNYLQIRKYDREGPFFFTGEQAIALEGSV